MAMFAGRTPIVLIIVFVTLAVPAVLASLFGLAKLSATARRPPIRRTADHGLQPCPDRPNCVSSQSSDPQHAIEPIAYTGSVGEALEALRELVEQPANTRVVASSADYLHVEYVSDFFGFVDDVEFLADPADQVIHVRSASRVGYSDLGANRRRVEELRAAFAAR